MLINLSRFDFALILTLYFQNLYYKNSFSLVLELLDCDIENQSQLIALKGLIMKRVGLFFGSTSGNTEIATNFMKEYLEASNIEVRLFDISDYDINQMENFTNLIIGFPTWNIGDLQYDWDTVFNKYSEIVFENKIGAFFGCGDQQGYPYNFLDAIGILAEPFIQNGGELIGQCDRNLYKFDDSRALKEGKLMGLGLDYDNFDESECELLIMNWLDQIMNSFK